MAKKEKFIGKFCNWTLDDDGDTYTTACKFEYDCERWNKPGVVNYPDIYVEFKYCPFCGRLIRLV